jgi:glyoxylase-like metal-dependent hydrolase (beta-lactamase superfamily II)
MPKGMVTVPFNPVLINTGSKLVLIDTGNGPSGGPAVGHLMANLAAAGVDPKAIDIVVLTHLHPDHTNGIKAADGSLAFPNAEIKVPAQDWAFWTSADNAAKAASNNMMKNYFANVATTFAGLADKVTRYDWGKEVAPGITSIETSGHTPGHSSFVVASGSGKLLVQADVTNIPELFLRHPDWHVAFDVDPEKAVTTRRRFYDMAATEKVLVAGYHFSFPSMGYVERDGTNFRLVPVRWSPSL